MKFREKLKYLKHINNKIESKLNTKIQLIMLKRVNTSHQGEIAKNRIAKPSTFVPAIPKPLHTKLSNTLRVSGRYY